MSMDSKSVVQISEYHLYSPCDPKQHSHVPKFGNWDSENVPYTAHFENARRERGGVMINPNDPMENPEIFNTYAHISHRHSHHNNEGSLEKKGSHQHHVHQKSRGSQSFISESGSERSHSDHKKSHGSLSSSSSHHRHRSGSHSFNDPHMNHEGTVIPKFGDWDVTDPKSGEGYTAIFSKIQNEKHAASSSSHSPSRGTLQLNNCSNLKNQYEGQSSNTVAACFQAKANEHGITGAYFGPEQT
ncbi:hypothetical protein PIB30_034756 [Stylosanthes scabra]|uniref:RIN4 pathogenic type III effector avirulence factor Avr cleavage site domain-containing protein n=1 Tax=Stylosanthes scabra TaxID=79078 RepID=A0ABU6ZBG6_9FABA|nr:hypothetical protein [Stylosanthes scabra]